MRERLREIERERVRERDRETGKMKAESKIYEFGRFN